MPAPPSPSSFEDRSAQPERRRRIASVALALIALTSVAVLLSPEALTSFIGQVTGLVIHGAGGAILLFCSLLLLLGLIIAASPAGRLRLGGDGERPEFGLPSWLAMLFAAGMGSGLVFWGVAEPLTQALTLERNGVDQAAATGMALTWFHWGLHAWAIYALSALAIAWFHTRRDAREVPSASIELGLRGWAPAKVLGGVGTLADLAGVAAVVFGVAGALANSIVLLRVGIDATTGWSPDGISLQLAILAALTLVFMASAISGIGRGIRTLSNLNLIVAFALLLTLLVLGTGPATMDLALGAMARWTAEMPLWSVRQVELPSSSGWAEDWTLTYLVWWIAWTPFVGVFIARISRGRTLRTFLAGVILIPTLFSMLWFAVLGGGAVAYDQAQYGMLTQALSEHYTRPLFLWLDALPAGALLMAVVCLLLFVFMVTSADSACFVLGMLSTGRNNPSTATKLAWGLLLTALTAGLVIRNDVDVNRAVAIVGAIPFMLVLLLQVIGLCRALFAEIRRKPARPR
jgi:glycine betaine transporter